MPRQICDPKQRSTAIRIDAAAHPANSSLRGKLSEDQFATVS